MKKMLTLLLILNSVYTYAQESNNVCLELKDEKSGLYGLCQAYCDESNKSDKAKEVLLSNYNKLKDENSPNMPCIEPPVECPLFTLEDIDGIGVNITDQLGSAIGVDNQGNYIFDPLFSGYLKVENNYQIGLTFTHSTISAVTDDNFTRFQIASVIEYPNPQNEEETIYTARWWQQDLAWDIQQNRSLTVTKEEAKVCNDLILKAQEKYQRGTYFYEDSEFTEFVPQEIPQCELDNNCPSLE